MADAGPLAPAVQPATQAQQVLQQPVQPPVALDQPVPTQPIDMPQLN